MLKKIFTAAVLGASLSLIGCASTPTEPTPGESITASNLLQLQQQTWILSHLGNLQVTTATSTTNIPSLNFASDSRVSGADGCNRLSGSYTATRDSLSFSQMAGTKMACANKNYVPEKFNQALTQVTHYYVYGDTLKLLDRSGNVLLQFTGSKNPR